MMDQHLLSISEKYNRERYRSFAHKGAETRFLSRLSLTKHTLGLDSLPKQEQIIYFEALHFLKYKLKKAIDKDSRQETNKWSNLFYKVRNIIVEANLGLVGKCVEMTFIRYDYGALFSLGSLTLIRSVELFDPWRGASFSTYACTAILRSFTRIHKSISAPAESCPDPVVLLTPPNEPSNDRELFLDRLKCALVRNTAQLSDREMDIIECRYGLNGNNGQAMKLDEVGERQNITKERVRQIQSVALEKLKTALDRDSLLC